MEHLNVQIVIKLKGENYIKKVIVEDYNTPLSTMDRSSRQKINREIADVNSDGKVNVADIIFLQMVLALPAFAS